MLFLQNQVDLHVLYSLKPLKHKNLINFTFLKAIELIETASNTCKEGKKPSKDMKMILDAKKKVMHKPVFLHIMHESGRSGNKKGCEITS